MHYIRQKVYIIIESVNKASYNNIAMRIQNFGNTNKSIISNSAKKDLKKLKIILLGEIGVGKTSIINRYVNNKFNTFSQPTIGADIKTKKVELDQNLAVELLINDTTNEEIY